MSADDLYFPPDFAPRVVGRVHRGVLLRRSGLFMCSLLVLGFALLWPRLHRAPAQRSLVASAAEVCPWGPSPSFFGDGETALQRPSNAQADDDFDPLP